MSAWAFYAIALVLSLTAATPNLVLAEDGRANGFSSPANCDLGLLAPSILGVKKYMEVMPAEIEKARKAGDVESAALMLSDYLKRINELGYYKRFWKHGLEINAGNSRLSVVFIDYGEPKAERNVMRYFGKSANPRFKVSGTKNYYKFGSNTADEIIWLLQHNRLAKDMESWGVYKIQLNYDRGTIDLLNFDQGLAMREGPLYKEDFGSDKLRGAEQWVFPGDSEEKFVPNVRKAR